MSQKVIKEGIPFKKTFLGGSKGQKYLNFEKAQLCIENNNQLSWSIQQEEIKQEDNILNKSNEQTTEQKQLALLYDMQIEKSLDTKVNSMYCNDYTSDANQEIFRNLLNKVIILFKNSIILLFIRSLMKKAITFKKIGQIELMTVFTYIC